MSFFSNKANIPGLKFGVTEQPTYLKNIDIPGDKIQYSDFTLSFIVDENLENYMQIHKLDEWTWIPRISNRNI